MNDRRTQPGGDGETAVLVAAAVVGGLVAWVWAASQLAGRVGHGRPETTAATLAAAVFRMPWHLGDPRSAWPQPIRTTLPGAAVFYGCALAAIVPPALILLLWRYIRSGARSGRPGPGSRRGPGARWASRADLRRIRIGPVLSRSRLVIGRDRRWPGRGLVAVESRHSLLVIGPTQSGKTTGLAIPAILEWRGPVIATSVKDDLGASTLAWRAARGPAWVFDPTASSGLEPRARWSPLVACEDWSGAQKVSGWLVESTPARAGMADAAFWYAAATKQLSPLLLAARSGGLGMADVVRWTNAGEFDEPARILELAGQFAGALALEACAGRDERIRSSVGTTLETVLAPFEDPVVAAATDGSDVDMGELLASRGTLYLCGPSHEQQRVQGVFAALVSAAVAEAVSRVHRAGKPLDPPLLLVLDEVANIAPIRDLDSLASTGAGLGVQLVTVCQDLAQMAARYGPDRSRTITNNHRAKLLLSGVSDLATLDLLSGLAGDQLVREQSVTRDLRDGRRTTSSATALRRLAPTDELRRTPPGQGVLIYGHLPPVRIRLRPWYNDRRLRRRVESRSLRLASPARRDPGWFARHLRIHRRPRGIDQA